MTLTPLSPPLPGRERGIWFLEGRSPSKTPGIGSIRSIKLPDTYNLSLINLNLKLVQLYRLVGINTYLLAAGLNPPLSSYQSFGVR